VVGEVPEVVGDVAEVVGDVADVVGDVAEVVGDVADVVGEVAEVVGEVPEVVGEVEVCVTLTMNVSEFVPSELVPPPTMTLLPLPASSTFWPANADRMSLPLPLWMNTPGVRALMSRLSVLSET
jgi:uncharacterized protein YjbJ (UPF0337 family)